MPPRSPETHNRKIRLRACRKYIGQASGFRYEPQRELLSAVFRKEGGIRIFQSTDPASLERYAIVSIAKLHRGERLFPMSPGSIEEAEGDADDAETFSRIESLRVRARQGEKVVQDALRRQGISW